MGFKFFVSLLILALVLMSCSSINFIDQPDYSKRDYHEFNSYGSEYSSIIYLLDDSEIKTDYVFAKDSLIYYALQTDTLSIQQSKIEKIEIKATGNKIANGLLWGLVGLAASLTLAAIFFPSANDGGAALIIYPVLIIPVLSSITGYVKGDKEYLFNDRANYEQIEYYKRKAERDSTNSGN